MSHSQTMFRTVAEYLNIIRENYSGENWIFRGQANINWDLISSAERRIQENKESLTKKGMTEYLEFLLDDAKRFLPQPLPDLDILAYLQHYGAATNLLDFSQNPLIALWMACGGQNDCDGQIFFLNKNSVNVKIVGDHEKRKSINALIDLPGVPIWKPDSSMNRINSQSSVFVLTNGELEFNTERILIKAENKEDLFHELVLDYSLSPTNIYPDLVGVAVANSTRQPYKPEDYLFRCLQYISKKDFSKAETCLCLAKKILNKNEKYIEFAECSILFEKGLYEESLNRCRTLLKKYPLFQHAKFLQGRLCAERNDTLNAIKIYTDIISHQPEYFYGAYANRGQAYHVLEKYEEALRDYDKALTICPNYALGYLGRAGLYYNWGGKCEDFSKMSKALADCRKVLELMPNNSDAQELLQRIKTYSANMNA